MIFGNEAIFLVVGFLLEVTSFGSNIAFKVVAWLSGAKLEETSDLEGAWRWDEISWRSRMLEVFSVGFWVVLRKCSKFFEAALYSWRDLLLGII